MPDSGPRNAWSCWPDVVHALDGDVRRGVGIAASDHQRADDVRRVGRRGTRGPSSGGRDGAAPSRSRARDRHGLERLVLDAHGGSRAPGLLGLLGRDDRDRLAEVAHAVDREHRLVGELEAVGLLPGNVLVGEDGVDAGQGARRRSRRSRAARARAGCARCGPQSIPAACRSLEYANSPVTFGTASARRVAVAACPRRTRPGGGAHRSAARWTASRIFW